MRVIIVGGGAFAREVACWAKEASAANKAAGPSAYLDDAGPGTPERYGLEWLGSIDSYQPRDDDALLMAIGDPVTKAAVAQKLRHARFATLVHPSAVVAHTAVLADGVIVGPQSYVAADARLHTLVGVNSLTGIGHDVEVGAYSTISSQVDLMGGVSLGERVFVGSGARVLPNVAIGNDARLGAGSVVVRKVKAGATVFATPARSLR